MDAHNSPRIGWNHFAYAPLNRVYDISMPQHSPTNPFTMLGVPQRFDIDRDAVEKAYRAALTRAHPDAGAPGESLDPAALNQARGMLLDDEQRASELLAIMGGPDASSCKALPDGFLMSMMMQRQEIEEAIESGGEAEREQWEEWGIDQRRDYRDQVAGLFAGLDESPGAHELREIRVRLNAWRYIERLIEQLDPEYDPASADF